jgi:hypothetical protein
MKQKKKWCYYCRHRGDIFKLHDGNHCHCEHKDKSVAGEPGWDTLRRVFESCTEFKQG